MIQPLHLYTGCKSLLNTPTNQGLSQKWANVFASKPLEPPLAGMIAMTDKSLIM